LAPQTFPTPDTAAQQIEQGNFQRIVGKQSLKEYAEPAANGFNAFVMGGEFPLIFRAQRIRIEINLAPAFRILKERCAMKIKGEFVGVEQLEDNNFMPRSRQSAQA